MKKIHTYYRAILWATLLTSLAACGRHSKNYMMPGTPSSASQKVLGNQSGKLKAPEWAPLLAEFNRLMQQFTQCVSDIDRDRNNYSVGSIFRIDTAFQYKQRQDNQQQHRLMPYDGIKPLDFPKMSKAASECLTGLCSSSFMSMDAKTFDQVVSDLVDMLYKTYVVSNDSNIQPQSSYRGKHPAGTVYNPTLNDPPIKLFDNDISGYLYQTLLPYWGKVVELLLFHALNTSLAQGKIYYKLAKEKYGVIRQEIESIYTMYYRNNQKNSFQIGIRKAISHTSSDYGCSATIKDINYLKRAILGPITSMYTELSRIISEIEIDDVKLKKEVIGSLKIYYNIACCFGIMHLLSNVGSMLPIYSFSNITSPLKKRALLQEVGVRNIQLLIAEVYLADFIAGRSITLDEINKKVKEIVHDISNLSCKDKADNVNDHVDQPNLLCNHKKRNRAKSHSRRG